MMHLEATKFTSAAAIIANAQAVRNRLFNPANRWVAPPPITALMPEPLPAPIVISRNEAEPNEHVKIWIAHAGMQDYSGLREYNDRRYAPDFTRRVKISEILTVVSEHYKVSITDILSAQRTRAIMPARQMAAYLARKLTLLSLPGIGQKLGGRDHKTMIHALRRVEAGIKADAAVGKIAELLTTKIKGEA